MGLPADSRARRSLSQARPTMAALLGPPAAGHSIFVGPTVDAIGIEKEMPPRGSKHSRAATSIVPWRGIRHLWENRPSRVRQDCIVGERKTAAGLTIGRLLEGGHWRDPHILTATMVLIRSDRDLRSRSSSRVKERARPSVPITVAVAYLRNRQATILPHIPLNVHIAQVVSSFVRRVVAYTRAAKSRGGGDVREGTSGVSIVGA